MKKYYLLNLSVVYDHNYNNFINFNVCNFIQDFNYITSVNNRCIF